MNRGKKYLDKNHKTAKGKSSASTGSSDYNSCCDNPFENRIVKKEKLNESLQSVILAGHIHSYNRESTFEDSFFNLPNARTSSENSYSVNVLDQNLDIFMEDNDNFMDCKDSSQTDSNADESTKYLQLETAFKLSKLNPANSVFTNHLGFNKLDNTIKVNESNDTVLNSMQSHNENERLITIMEETEVTHASHSIRNNQSLMNCANNLKDCDSKILTRYKIHDKISNSNKYSMKRVLFANEKDDESEMLNKLKERKKEQISILQASKDKCCAGKIRGTDENCNNHNTTESFVLWEKACKSSEKLLPRRSYSFSELTSSENYTGDDEYSTSFKTLDNTFISEFGVEINDKNISQKRSLMYKSKSCDSLLREVKHLPHVLYDKFLKCLAKEIEHIRRQNIVCTCSKLNNKSSNKENIEANLKYNTTVPSIKVSNEKVEIESKFSFKKSPVKLVTNTNQRKLSPENLKRVPQEAYSLSQKNTSKTSTTPSKKYNQSKLSPDSSKYLPQDRNKLSPKSINKTPTTPSKKRGLYSWQKEIVSPVGEYIRGKRQSPFKVSPNKKKL